MHAHSFQMALICAVMFLDALGIGLLVPVLPDVILKFHTDPALAARYYGLFLALYSLMQFLASPVLGALSDRYGRRPVLLVSLLGASLDYLLMAIAPSLGWLFCGRAIAGLTGANVTVASSYIGDISSDASRTANFGLASAAFGVGFIAGPALTVLLVRIAPQAPFLIAAALLLLNFVMCLFGLPETLPASLRKHDAPLTLHPFGSLHKAVNRSGLAILLLVHVALSLADQVYGIWAMDTKSRFGWSELEIGLSMSLIGILLAFGQGYLIRVFSARVGDPSTLLISAVFHVIGFVCFALVTHGYMLYLALIVACPSGLSGPTVRAMISQRVAVQEQGEMQGNLAALGSLTSVVGPLLYAPLLGYGSLHGKGRWFEGAPYLLAALLSVGAVILLLRRDRSAKDALTHAAPEPS